MTPDIIITIANTLIFISFLPSIFSKDKPHAGTSLLNVIVSGLFIWGYSMLGLEKTIVMNSLIGIGWAILLFQKLMDKS